MIGDLNGMLRASGRSGSRAEVETFKVSELLDLGV